jgi:hypothetical protein
VRPGRRAPSRRPARAGAPVEIDPRFAPVAAAFAGRRGVLLEPGWGRGNLVLKAGGKIFALLAGAGFVAKLPKARVDALVAAGEGTCFDPRKNGHVMKQWLMASDEAEWVTLAIEAHRFVTAGAAGHAK